LLAVESGLDAPVQEVTVGAAVGVVIVRGSLSSCRDWRHSWGSDRQGMGRRAGESMWFVASDGEGAGIGQLEGHWPMLLHPFNFCVVLGKFCPIVKGFIIGRKVWRLRWAGVQVGFIAGDGGVALVNQWRQWPALLHLIDNSIDFNEF